MTRWQIVGLVLFVLGMLNFLTFVAVDATIGGDALNGKTENGHYFVMDHGHYTEVSHGLWVYSAIHAGSVFFTQPLGIFGGLLWGYPKLRREGNWSGSRRLN
jgi:hypothetical protein